MMERDPSLEPPPRRRGRPTPRPAPPSPHVVERGCATLDAEFERQLGPCELLSESMDAEDTVRNIAHAATRCGLADFCIVDLLAPQRTVRRLEVASRRPEHAHLAAALLTLPLDATRPRLGMLAAETREPQLVAEVTPAFLASVAPSPEHEAVLRRLDARSCIAAPLAVGDRLLGTITLVVRRERPPYGPRDVTLALALAHRAAIALDYARTCEAARRAAHARDELLGVVAHDLRTPLNGIVLAASLAQQRLPSGSDPVVQRALDGLLRETERMNHLIQDLLDVAHLEAGTLAIAPRPQPPLDLATDAVLRMGPLAAQDGVAIVCEVDPGLPAVAADPDRIQQVFSNLLGNALRHTPRSGRITIGAAVERDDIVFSVTDTGCGIAPERIPGLFDRFAASRSTGRTGKGFGLPIVAGIIGAHGGRVSARSEPGAGSMFTFTLPIAKSGDV